MTEVISMPPLPESRSEPYVAIADSAGVAGSTTTRRSLSIKDVASKRRQQKKKPALKRTNSCPGLAQYNDCREFDAFAGDWIDSKGQAVLISPWGVVRYPSNPKLRFEATFMGPNHLSVTFDKDPKKRKFVGKLNHERQLLVWSNDTKWVKKGCKLDPKFNNDSKRRSNSGDSKDGRQKQDSCLIQ
mmetsp:Transcript_2386/g.4635  ORF Transcript_2386/g.4635 Transcript_2386/m.4635 type:complete len:186 (-) Transcript_2386:518-1075(-)